MYILALLLNFFLTLIFIVTGKYHLREDDIGHPHGGHALYGKPRNKFFNDGRFYGWDSQHAEHHGKIQEVRKRCFDNKVDSDIRCLKFTQVYDPKYRERYHSEVVYSNATQHGQSGFYGFAFKLAEDWQFDPSYASGDKMINNRIAIAQFIAHFKDIDCGTNRKGAMPTTMVWLQNDELYLRLRVGTVCTETNSSTEYAIGRVVPGQWHTLVFGVLWHKQAKGWLKVWFDRQVVVNEANLQTILDVDDRLFQFRVGMYPNWWTYQGKGHPFIPPGLRKTRELYIDHVGYGPDLSDADPWSDRPSESSLRTKIAHYSHFISRMMSDSKSYGVSSEQRILDKLRAQLHNATRAAKQRRVTS